MSLTNNSEPLIKLPLTWKAMTMAEAAYVYTVKNTVECHKRII